MDSRQRLLVELAAGYKVHPGVDNFAYHDYPVFSINNNNYQYLGGALWQQKNRKK